MIGNTLGHLPCLAAHSPTRWPGGMNAENRLGEQPGAFDRTFYFACCLVNSCSNNGLQDTSCARPQSAVKAQVTALNVARTTCCARPQSAVKAQVGQLPEWQVMSCARPQSAVKAQGKPIALPHHRRCARSRITVRAQDDPSCFARLRVSRHTSHQEPFLNGSHR